MDRETEREITRLVNKEIEAAIKKFEYSLDKELDKIVRMLKDTEKNIRKDVEYQIKKEHDNMIKEIERRVKK